MRVLLSSGSQQDIRDKVSEGKKDWGGWDSGRRNTEQFNVMTILHFQDGNTALDVARSEHQASVIAILEAV